MSPLILAGASVAALRPACTVAFVPGLRPVQRLAAYVVLPAGTASTVLVRGSGRSDLPGVWSLPGGGVQHGEDPADAAVRETLEETGVRVRLTGLRDVVTDVMPLPQRGISLHTIRIVYAATADDADAPEDAGTAALALRFEQDGTSDLACAVGLDQAAGLPLIPFVAPFLGLPVAGPPEFSADGPVPGDPMGCTTPSLAAGPLPGDSPPSDPPLVQRAGAYALVLDAGQVLLSRYVGDGRWSLPGGGIHFGETPRQALLREVHEETSLPLAEPALADVDSVHFTGRSPSGRMEDFHAVRVVYTGRVPPGSQPQVLEVGGSADAAAWFPVDRVDQLSTTTLVRNALRLKA